MITQKQIKASIRLIEDEDVESQKRGRRRSLWEYFVLFPLIALSFYSVAYLFRGQVTHYRKIMLRQQLFQIRNALLVYHVLNSRFPSDLSILAGESVADPRGGINFSLLEGVKIDEKGSVLDPLGYPYTYSSATGRVSSGAPCCHSW